MAESDTKVLLIWQKLSLLGGKIISTRSCHNTNFHQQKSSIHMSCNFPANRDLPYSWPRSRPGGEIFSHMNAFTSLSEIIFFLRDRCKKVLRNHSIDCNNNPVIILFTKNVKQLYFCLGVGKEDIIKVLCCLWNSNGCRIPTKHKIRISSHDMFKYSKTQPFFFKFVSPGLNIGFPQNFPS